MILIQMTKLSSIKQLKRREQQFAAFIAFNISPVDLNVGTTVTLKSSTLDGDNCCGHEGTQLTITLNCCSFKRRRTNAVDKFGHVRVILKLIINNKSQMFCTILAAHNAMMTSCADHSDAFQLYMINDLPINLFLTRD